MKVGYIYGFIERCEGLQDGINRLLAVSRTGNIEPEVIETVEGGFERLLLRERVGPEWRNAGTIYGSVGEIQAALPDVRVIDRFGKEQKHAEKKRKRIQRSSKKAGEGAGTGI